MTISGVTRGRPQSDHGVMIRVHDKENPQNVKVGYSAERRECCDSGSSVARSGAASGSRRHAGGPFPPPQQGREEAAIRSRMWSATEASSMDVPLACSL